MKITKITTAIALLFLVGSLTIVSCKKKTEETNTTSTTDDEQNTANDNNVSENTASDIESIGAQASENAVLTTYRSSDEAQVGGIDVAPCATVIPAGGGLKTFTVDFGTIGCTGSDGRTRTGKLIFDYSGSTGSASFYRHPGFKLNITSANYVVDGYTVNITNKTITNTTPNSIPSGINPGTNLTWSIAANINIVKPSSGGTIGWTCNRTKELINTGDTTCYRGQNKSIVWSRAKVKLNGTASGTNAKGESYSATATDLIRDFQCAPDALKPHRHPFVSGTINYVPANRAARLINYGSGTCDFNAVVTINGKDYNVTLP